MTRGDPVSASSSDELSLDQLVRTVCVDRENEADAAHGSGALHDEAALALLGSSTSRRYVREATRLARTWRLAERLEAKSARGGALRRVRALLAEVGAASARGGAEIEAALLLAALGKALGSEAGERLGAFSAEAANPSPWLRALVRELVAHAPPTRRQTTDARRRLRSAARFAVVVRAFPRSMDTAAGIRAA